MISEPRTARSPYRTLWGFRELGCIPAVAGYLEHNGSVFDFSARVSRDAQGTYWATLDSPWNEAEYFGCGSTEGAAADDLIRVLKDLTITPTDGPWQIDLVEFIAARSDYELQRRIL